MLKSKSFTLSRNTNRNQKQRDLLYEPRRIRWNRYIITLSLIAFSLLLVLSNVSFSGDSYEMVVVPLIVTENPTAEVVTSTTSDNYDAITTAGGSTTEDGDREEQEENDSAVISVLSIEAAAAQVPVTSFTCKDNNTCKTIICTGQPVNSIAIQEEMEYLVRWCSNIYFDVIIENCVFQKNTIDAYMFSGSYRLNTLTIRNCQLQTIADSAFKQTTMNKLVNLTLEGVQLQSLSEKTFAGLQTVQNFTLINRQQTTDATLTASNFLQPMAASLITVILQQTQEKCNCQTIYNPTDWLGAGSDTLYEQLLFVDLSGTNFNHTLNNETFSKLVAVQQLRLANCNLSVIGENVFTEIVQTLQFLDLRGNNLQRLDGDFLATLATLNNVTVEMSRNLWHCDCEITGLVYYLQQVDDNYAGEVVCTTPLELRDVQIRYMQLNCNGLVTTTNANSLTNLSTTTVKPTAATKTTQKTITTQVTKVTTETTTAATPITTVDMPKITTTIELPRTSNTTTMLTQTTSTKTTTKPTTPITEATTITITKSTTQNTTQTVTFATEITTEEQRPKTTTAEPTTKITILTTKATTLTTIIPTTRKTESTTLTITEPMTTTTSKEPETTTTTEKITITQTIPISNSTIPTSPLTTTTVSPIDMMTTMPWITTTPWMTTTPSQRPNTTTISTETTSGFTPNTTMVTTTAKWTPTTTEDIDTTFPTTPETTRVPMSPTMSSTNGPKTTIITSSVSNTPTTVNPTELCYQNKFEKFLVCTDTIVRLCDYDIPFNVTTISPQGVQLRFGSNASSFEVIYFPALDYSNYQELAVGSNSNIHIDYLTSNQSYLFCLLPIEWITTSPFNCRSAYLPPATPKSWLDSNDKALFITISVLITVVCIIVGVAAVYFLLRWRPTFMHGSKRLRRLASTSHEVLLFPKRERTSLDSQTYAMNELSNMPSSISDTLTPENCLNIKSYDYMQYFKNHELNKKHTNVAYISYIRPPDNRAPALPPEARGERASNSCSGYIPVPQLSQQSTVIMENEPKPLKSCLRSGSRLPSNGKAVEFENEYESLDYYQEIY